MFSKLEEGQGKVRTMYEKHEALGAQRVVLGHRDSTDPSIVFSISLCQLPTLFRFVPY